MTTELSQEHQPDLHRVSCRCPNCRTVFALEDALVAEINEAAILRFQEEHAAEIDRVRQEAAEHARAEASEKHSVELRIAREDASEQRAVNTQLREELVGLNRQMRKLDAERVAEELQNETALRNAEERIRGEEKERAIEERRLKELELEKKVADARDDAARLRARLEQGSQQTQGEVLERDLEVQLRELFPSDEIVPVKTGVRGADVRQTVRTPLGVACGAILYEAKNAAQWRTDWCQKLKQDMCANGVDHGVLVAAHTPESIRFMGNLEGRVWAVRPRAAATLAAVLRQTLLHTHAVTALSADKGERIEALYRYVTSPDFRHRIETIQEFFTHLHEDDEKEKAWMLRKWARRDKEARIVIENVLGLVGDFEGLNGTAILPALPPAAKDEPPVG